MPTNNNGCVFLRFNVVFTLVRIRMLGKQLKLIFLMLFTCLLMMSCQPESDDVKTEHLSAPIEDTFYIGVPSEAQNKVYMHYLPWFSEGEAGNHWQDGSVTKPLIGYYNSKSWATHIYHILLSSLIGIDGAVINVRTAYDQEAFDLFIASLKRIEAIYPSFDYSVAISYDDQDMDDNTATTAMAHLKNNILTTTNHYLYKDNAPVIFIWDYDGYLSSESYRDIVNSMFSEQIPILLKNDLYLEAAENEMLINAFYPWVKGFSEDGSNWGEAYIDWFYATSLDFVLTNKAQFIIGAVWPGFDDRQASWGQQRWIDRNNGILYETLWSKIHEIDGNIEWVIIETWNDFNEGSEIEPIEGDDPFQYVALTASNIALYKNKPSHLEGEASLLNAVVKIYEAAALIETDERDETVFYDVLKEAIQLFLQKQSAASIALSDSIIDART